MNLLTPLADIRRKLDAECVDALLADPAFLATGIGDRRGVPPLGRASEMDLLRAVGARDLPLGRLFEGHVNALQLVARFGDTEQAASAARDAERGALFGVWNTGPAENVRITSEDDDGIVLGGRKTFCSGAGRVARAIVTASRADGRSQMTLVPMDRAPVVIDPDSWHPMGMEASDSFIVSFEGVRLARRDLIGGPGEYERAPWFTGGAARFLAVQTGALERLVDELARFLASLGRDGDAIALARVGECAVAAETSRLWVDACAAAWAAFDDEPTPERESELLGIVDAARVAVERAALDVAERVERAVGARGLLEPLPFGRMIRDLRMYLRQPAPDAALARVGRLTVERSRSSR